MMKKLICILLAAVMVLSLAACGDAPQETTPVTTTTVPPQTTLPPETTQPPLTAKTVAEQMVQAVAGKPMTGGTVAMSFGFTMVMGEEEETVEIAMEMDLEMDMKLSVDPIAMYTDNQITVKMTGMDTTVQTESYFVMEDGQLVSYSHMIMDDSWTKATVPADQVQDITQTADYSWLLEKEETALTLEEEIQTVDGREVYVLGCTLTGDEMQKTLDSSSGMEDPMSSLGISEEDFAVLQVPTVYYIDAHTFYPVEIRMDVTGFDSLLNSVLANSLGMDLESTGMEIAMGEMTMSMTDLCYDPVEVPPVPQAAYDAMANTEVYQLTDAGKTVRVKLPLGWMKLEAADNTLSVVNSEYTQQALFILFADVTGIDFVKLIEDGDVASLKQNNQYVAHGMGEAIGDLQTMWLQAEQMNVYYAWGSMGDVYVYVHVLDTTGQTMEEALLPMLSAIILPTVE